MPVGFPAEYGHGNFSFNEHLNGDGTADETAVDNTVTIDRREWNTGFRNLVDPYHLATGGGLGRSHRGLKVLRIAGRLMTPDSTSEPSLADRERALMAAFDPALCIRDSPSTEGAYAFEFTERTTNTGTYAGGVIPLRFYCRPDTAPRLIRSIGDVEADYGLTLVGGDPRVYEQTEQTLNLTPGSASGAVLNRGTCPAPLKVTLTMSGNGNAAFTLTRSGISFVLNLSGVGASTIVVVMETCGPYGEGKLVTRNGTRNFALKTSGPSTWLDAPIGSTTFAMTNTTNVTGCLLSWYSARV